MRRHVPVMEHGLHLPRDGSPARQIDPFGPELPFDAELTRLEVSLFVEPEVAAAGARRIARRAKTAGDASAVDRAELVISDARSRGGELERALGDQRATAAAAEAAGRPSIAARANYYLASTYFRLGLVPQCQEAAAMALDLLDRTVAAHWRVEHLMVFSLFTSYRRAGRADYELFEEALREARGLGDPTLLLAVLNNFAWVLHLDPAQQERAEELAGEMESLLAKGTARASAAVLDTLACFKMAAGALSQAEQYIVRSLDQKDLVEPDIVAALTTHLAELRRLQNRPADAVELLERGRAIALEHETPQFAIDALRTLAELDAERADYRRAYRRLVRFLDEQEALERRDAERRAAALQSIYGTRSEREQRRLFEELAVRDSLTGLYNRRQLEEQLPRLIERDAVTLAINDIDDFKHVNDTHSHSVGDAVIRGVAHFLAGVVESLDRDGFAVRLGGDEFVLIIPGVCGEDAIAALDAMRRHVSTSHFDGTPDDLRVTLSIGLATTLTRLDTSGALLARADEAMYRAKRGGRDELATAA